MLRTVILALLALLLSASAASAQEPTPLPAAPGSEAEPNDTPETATPISDGGRIRATRTPDDVDLYSFTAAAGDRVYATVVTAASQSSDSRLALLGPDGSELESDDDDGTFRADSSSLAGTTAPVSGTYHLRVDSPRAGTRLAPYDVLLEVQSGAATTEVEPNNGPQTMQPLGDARLVSGTKAANDFDVYALELGAGDTVFLSLDLDPERDGGAVNGRLGFGLENQLLIANDGGTGDAIPSEAWVGSVHSAGTYLVSVDATGSAFAQSGTYQLSITVIRAVEGSCRTYTVEPADGALPDRSAVTFPIDVPDPATVDHVALRLDLTHSFMSDLDATLQAPAGNRIAVFDDIGSTTAGGSSRMLATFDDAAGTPPMYTWLKGFVLQPERYRLDWFAGQHAEGTWNLTFRDDATDDTGTLARADLILCERPAEGPAESLFSAGFEDGDDGFEHSGAADEWERGTPSSTGGGGELAGLTTCGEGDSCFKTDLDGTYEPTSSQDLVSPPISLEHRTGQISASWAMWYQLESASFDRFTVSVEEDGGANARPLFESAGGDMVASQGNPLEQMAFSAGWGRHVADVSDYAGKTIRLRFHLETDENVQRRGVAIDDVRVYQPRAVAEAGAYETDEDVPPGDVLPSTASDVAAISDLQLGSRCVRRTATGRVRVPMTMTLSQPGAVRVRVDRAVGSRARSSCPRANPGRNQRFRRVATFRPVAKVRAASVARQVVLDLRLRPGLYRLTVRVKLADGRLSSPVRRFLRVVGTA
jgi:hypothetical protein